ncbi:septum formation inhibitor Maf [Eikenella sp. S3360]|uniref:dTTP/UTP pyrophosphatase n=1 Tax=Eikenella glucosivorans TaxID=2766967 RepID=A0ABS0N7H0_9NEIS|nr:nucleoside triphosphate pyrophosphatase [Eikenella glucosivorans]MBH5328241.1 septum formation inhibitor Maf [Eikenella glucosivorans]
MPQTLYLASASPRRRELLNALGFRTLPLPAEIDESALPGEAVADYVARMARQKNAAARQILRQRGEEPAWPVLSADTVVALEERILGKPRDAAHARAMLESLSGREHQVWTAVCASHGGQTLAAVQRSDVRFKALGAQEIQVYIDSGEPLDKAGAYGIQGVGGVFVTHLAGSFSGVMGLPVFETVRLLRQLGAEVPPFGKAT